MKTVIITGSRGLIGTVVAKHLKETGYKVAELDIALGHDLEDEYFVKTWFSENPAHGLVNLFALNDHIEKGRASNKFMDISLDAFSRFLQVNVVALFSVCREFARSNSKGTIVNFSSTYGIVSPNPILYSGDEKNIAYGVSKAAVIQLTRHLAVHLAPSFRVNCIVPGGVKHKQSEEFQKLYGAHTPLGRMMEAEELCGMVDFLISDNSSYCTAGVYSVDGGWTAW
jgi:NAD(P)-dependent dehydrogenase (short-subunit alcohol dehydrogenase family)